MRDAMPGERLNSNLVISSKRSEESHTWSTKPYSAVRPCNSTLVTLKTPEMRFLPYLKLRCFRRVLPSQTKKVLYKKEDRHTDIALT